MQIRASGSGLAGAPPRLTIVVPCYNEEDVLPETAPMFADKLSALVSAGLVDGSSKILFVDDGSTDGTWRIIQGLSRSRPSCRGIRQSRNRGHQNALVAGLTECLPFSDAAITVDCDGQDDVDAMDAMVKDYLAGADVVYGVRSSRESDSFLKRTTAQAYYRLLAALGAEVVYNHADYRLTSARVIEALGGYREVNLYLRGLFPLIGFKSTTVEYVRHVRLAGRSHYPLGKMLALSLDGITSLSSKPISLIIGLGAAVSLLGFTGAIWSVVSALMGSTVSGWASLTCIVCFTAGVQLLCIGVIGEYVGKIYLESKHRPRFVISERTWGEAGDHVIDVD